MQDKIAQVFFVFLAICAGIAGIWWHFWRSRSLLERWAAENGYEIIHSEYRHLLKGPFFWTTSRGQTVYYVQVIDSTGYQRNGWVRCGSWWLGLMSDSTEVRWEDS